MTTRRKPDALATYRQKRDFKKTREPKAGSRSKSGHLFIVQKHDATRLHWDFRLEMDGVLKSWAVTRGPSLDPHDKRLAVRTEDHPMAYAEFEGTIPAGEYGGGTVMLWDEGEWEAVGGKDPAKTIGEGHVHVILHGERMKGEWLLVRMKSRPGEKRENWLLRKADDKEAGGSDDLVGTALTSVASGRSMAEIAEGGDPVWHSDGKKSKADSTAANAPGKAPPKAPAKKKSAGRPPPFRAVQLATLVDHVPPGTGWLHEVKYDGYRALLAVAGDRVKAYTRHGLDWSDRFAPIVDAMAGLGLDAALIDGEMVALDKDGRPSFSALQAALKDGGELHYFAFDLLAEGGEDLTTLANAERKERLAALLKGAESPIHYADHIASGGEKLFDRLCREGYEGIVSKRADAPYRGTRSRNWLKVKCTRRQEFVILGYVESDKKGRDLRSLAIGLNEGGQLRYAGRVGTGFDAQTREMLLVKLKPLTRKTAPADVPRVAARGVRWVTPKLVAEVAFAEFTADNVVRHASFLGLREDKKANEVVPEKPAAAEAGDTNPFGIAISHPDRVIDPDGGITKGQLADYYAAMADPVLRGVAGRPVSLVRCPQGRDRKCFFQKHDAGSFGDHVGHVAIREKDGSSEDYLVVEDSAGLLACVQMGTIEFHGWGAPAADVEKPDRLVFDLDPDEGLDFAAVVSAARHLRDLLGEMGLATFPMVTGGKGVHVIAPLTPGAEWPAVKDFARRFAAALAGDDPDRFTAALAKKQRKGRIFIDYLRNQRGATAVMPYSARARAGSPVAVPVTWEELRKMDGAARWNVGDAKELAKRAGSKAMARWGIADQTLPDL
ncbi:DNA ligase D [Sphingomonas oryzagri]